ncbi:hypothetical protein SPRG_20981 [Saprolegnia parasitica CBS 223.65]|uniref:Apple domain-containing protein n=1 Tax=Saprolegnia parasitica (strain CBS 223.65) TaxID=695850 RepID=A0A067BXJ9_SAPPC|nr:hypothetical protein SPRG_20981 [Saprolegnia parasitica CBS 223.65]KDO23229.1 hypothetical protein SPRG_20981 [Saprolegnia parasitica CBS 223.65]|eukprot:XP_012206070.1 hypothetical protein SPRG_20981 [Saprolegnia parasitica CBS 223.65]
MQLLTTTVLLAAMAFTTTYARTCGAPEWNTDFAGSDMSNFKTTGDFGNMLKQCCDACTASSTCVAYTLADNVCYLKSGAGSRQPKTGATSVLMSGTSPPVSTCSAPEINVDYYGNDISNVAVSGNQVDQLQACCTACSKTRRKASPGVVSAKTTSVTTTPTPTPTPTPAGNRTCGAPEWNTDYYGNDISNFPTSGLVNDMFKQCCDACKTTPSCGAYTLSGQVCYLKTVAGNRRSVNGAMSAVVSGTWVTSTPTSTVVIVRTCVNPPLYNADFFGSDIAILPATGEFNAMLGQCCEACKKNMACNAYVLFEGVCYLKSASTSPLAKSGATAAIVTTMTIAS